MLFRETVRTDRQRFAEMSGGPQVRATIGLMPHPRVFPVVLIRVAAKLHSLGLRRLAGAVALINMFIFRSEERRGGKECVSTCRSRRSPYQYTNKKNISNRTKRDVMTVKTHSNQTMQPQI